MPRYYVSWFVDCAYGAMHVHAIFDAPDIQTAKQDWRRLVHEQNQVATEPAYPNKKPLYEELWRLPDFLQGKTKEEALDYYAPPERCSFARDTWCSASENCQKFKQPYGCYQKKHDEWERRWKPLVPEPERKLTFFNRLWS